MSSCCHQKAPQKNSEQNVRNTEYHICGFTLIKMAGGIPDHMLSIAQNLHSVSELQNIYLHKTERERVFRACGGPGANVPPKASQAVCLRTVRYIPEFPGFNPFSFCFFTVWDHGKINIKNKAG